MKAITFISALALAVSAMAGTNRVTGVNSYMAGYLVGDEFGGNGHLNRSVAIGAYSVYNLEMGTLADSGTFLGYGAGSYMGGAVTNCVAIGPSAMSGASAMSGCVAIGENALAGKSGQKNAVDLNGNLYASETDDVFWLTPSRNRPALDAPIFYANGVLRLNADVVTSSGSVIARADGRIGGNDDGFHLFVSERGYDFNDGTSVREPLSSIDEAFLRVTDTTNIWRICLMPGTYTYPTNFPSINYEIVATGGRDRTFICTTTNDVSPEALWIVPDGSTGIVSGVTFRDVSARTNAIAGSLRANFYNVALRDCLFDDIQFEHNWSWVQQMPFAGCTMRDCEIYNARFTNMGSSSQDGCSIFAECDIDGLRWYCNSISNTTDHSNVKTCLFWGCDVRNACVIDTSGAWGVPFCCVDMDGNYRLADSTLVMGASGATGFLDAYATSRESFTNCAIFYGASAPSLPNGRNGGCVVGALADAYKYVGPDGRGLPGPAYCTGYKCAERAGMRMCLQGQDGCSLVYTNGHVDVYHWVNGVNTRIGTLSTAE